jgi:hypothetical protein
MLNRYYRICIAVMAALLTVSDSSISYGQHRAVLKAHVFQSIRGLYTVSFEHAFTKHISTDLSIQGGHYINVRPNRFEDYEVTGIAAIAALRYYPFTKKVFAPQGFFTYGAVRYVDFTETFIFLASGDEFKVGGTMVNAALGIGYKYVYRRVGLEAYVGWGAGWLTSDDKQYRENIPDFHRKSFEHQNNFAHLDFALCYMLSSVQQR